MSAVEEDMINGSCQVTGAPDREKTRVNGKEARVATMADTNLSNIESMQPRPNSPRVPAKIRCPNGRITGER